EYGYITQERSTHDRRSVRLKLTDKGLSLCAAVRTLQDDLSAQFGDADSAKALQDTVDTMLRLERTWSDFIHYGLPRR
ncbi:MAG: MarR family winged helix-turn-helix transcriptional regulator, partial [Magnetospirillum sp.]|nr:MarR family winged helix-turn-helix transcriptional regulator [Magnetospirillum sp.]